MINGCLNTIVKIWEWDQQYVMPSIRNWMANRKKIDDKLKKLSCQRDKIVRQKQGIIQKYADAEFVKEKARYEEAKKLLAEADKVIMSLMKNRAENTPYNEE